MNTEEYMLLDDGRIQGVAQRLREKTKLNPESGCIEWVAKAKANGGYGTLCVGRFGQVRAHRAAWILANGAIPKGKYVCHSCDNPACCNVAHLFLGSPADNMNDKARKGRGTPPPHRYGEDHHNAKITEGQALEIRKSKDTLESLALKYGVSTKTIWRIKKGLSWVRLRSTERQSS